MKKKLAPRLKLNPATIAVALTLIVAAGFLAASTRAADRSADLNGDGSVGVLDLSRLLTDWNKTGTGLLPDLNSDNAVNVIDLSMMLSKWGTSGVLSNELMKSAYPHAFVLQNGTPVKMNGVNVRDGGVYINNASDPNDNFAYPVSRWAETKAKGFNHARLALNWPDFEPAQGQFRADAFVTLDTTIANMKAAGMYTILDPIHLKSAGSNVPGWATGTDSVDIINQHAAPFLKYIANRYKNEPNVVAIDLVNEPHQASPDQNRVMNMYQALIAQIRPIDADKILIIEPTWGNSGLATVNWSIFTNKTNLVMSLHDYYAGGHATGYDAAGVPRGNYVWDGTSGYPTPNAAALGTNIDTFQGWLAPQQIPLYVGEYGIGHSATNVTQWVTDVVAAMNARNLPRTYWEWHSAGTMALNDQSWVWRPYTSIVANY